MPFEVGDRVRYLDEIGGGVVTKVIDNQYIEVKDDDGFTFRRKKSTVVSEGKSAVDPEEVKAKLKNLTKSEVNSRLKISRSAVKRPFSLTGKLQETRLQWTSKDRDYVEVDLHIEEVVEKPAHLSDGEKLEIQLEMARNCLDGAVEMKIRRIIFIHGIGSGVLKRELRNWLKTLSYVDFRHGDQRRYGFGATEVIIRASELKSL